MSKIDLLPEQADAADFFAKSSQSIVLEARPGTGKTFMLSQLDKLVDEAAVKNGTGAGKRVVYLAYNKSSRDSLAEKLPSREVRTFHSFGYKHLMYLSRQWRLYGNKYYQLARAWACSYYEDRDHAYKTIPSVIKMCDFLRSSLTDIWDIEAIMATVATYELEDSFDYDLINVYRALIVAGNQFAEDPKSVLEWLRDGIYHSNSAVNAHITLTLIGFGDVAPVQKYQEACAKRANGRWIDYTDQLYLPIFWDMEIDQYDIVFGDEFQDQNTVRLELALRAMAEGSKLVAVGDSYQAINGWCGADSRSLAITQERTGAKVLYLDKSFRCPKEHTKVARELTGYKIYSVDWAKAGSVQYANERQLYDKLADRYLGGDESLILSRTNAPLMTMAIKLLGQNIPCVVRGREFQKGIIDIIKKVAMDKWGRNEKPGFRWTDFPDELNRWFQNEDTKLTAKNASDGAHERLQDKYSSILALYDGFSGDRVIDLINEINAMFDDQRSENIVLSSIHRAKGQESDFVAILAPEKMPLYWGDNPSQEQMIQENNVVFVAYTRSKNELWLVPNEN